jgi:hypothetical protein
MPPLPPDPVCSNDPNSQQQKKKKKHSAQGGSGYIRKGEDIKQHVHDIRPAKPIDLFAKTTCKIGEYLTWTIKNRSEFWNALQPEDLGFETIVQPPEPADYNNLIIVKQWSLPARPIMIRCSINWLHPAKPLWLYSDNAHQLLLIKSEPMMTCREQVKITA